jgi:uncharacterized membrane protein YdfJ with MMPL/SSD domain
MKVLDALIRKHPRMLLLGWLAVVALSLPFAVHQSDRLTSGGFSVPGSQSAYVDTTLTRHFPGVERASLAVLLSPQRGATPTGIATDIARVQRALQGLPGLRLSSQAREQATFAAGLVGPIVMPLQVTASKFQARDETRKLRSSLKLGGQDGQKVGMTLLGQSALGAALQETSKRQLRKAETISFPLLVIILLAIFGSLWAATLPLALGAVAVVITGALIYLLSLTLELSALTVNAASMLGIGIAVDYSLIFIHRVRQELQAGHPLADAQRTALMTSGKAVVFSGITVMAALVGVWIVPIAALRSMALGAVIVVAISVMACVTLLPALTRILGARRMSSRLFTLRPATSNWGIVRRQMNWDRWTNGVVRHPLLTVIIVGAPLLALCLPVLEMRTGTGVLAQLDARSETRTAFAEAAKISGPGALGPTFVVLHAKNPVAFGSLRRAATVLRRLADQSPLVHELERTQFSRDGSYAMFTAILTVDPESPAAEHLIQRLRTSFASSSTVGLNVAVGGASAGQLDEVGGIATSMWKVLLAVLALSFIPIMVLLRSIVLPLKAVVMNFLSVGAAYGILVLVFQWGWFDPILHYDSPGHIDTLVPPLLLAIVFGLSTDYEVFLLSRIRESWLDSGDSRRAVAEGLAKSAKTISSAAFVIVCVFAVFIGTGVPTIKELGLGASFAIAIDATLIRLILVPAAMTILGDWNWWLPRPFARFSAQLTTDLKRASV